MTGERRWSARQRWQRTTQRAPRASCCAVEVRCVQLIVGRRRLDARAASKVIPISYQNAVKIFHFLGVFHLHFFLSLEEDTKGKSVEVARESKKAPGVASREAICRSAAKRRPADEICQPNDADRKHPAQRTRIFRWRWRDATGIASARLVRPEGRSYARKDVPAEAATKKEGRHCRLLPGLAPPDASEPRGIRCQGQSSTTWRAGSRRRDLPEPGSRISPPHRERRRYGHPGKPFCSCLTSWRILSSCRETVNDPGTSKQKIQNTPACLWFW
jgi:hypothetical protein